MTDTIGNWTVYDLIWFLVLWNIVQIIAPSVLRDVLGPAWLVIVSFFRRK